MADRLGASEGGSRLGRSRPEVSRSDGGVWCGGGGARELASRAGGAATDGETVARDGRCASASAEGGTGAGVEPVDVRAVGRERPDDFLQFRVRGGRGRAQDGIARDG